MTTTRLPFVGSGRLQEGGALAVRKQDFNAHVQGTGFRHDATQIDMNPVIPLVGGATVQETLENLHSLIVSAGTGFLSIGNVDGYIQGDYNVGTVETPTLHDTFNAAFADTRLQNGGLILVLAGTYHLRSTVTVPAGISIMGEIAGTTIIGEMQEVPMFVIQKPNQSIDLVTGTVFASGSNVDAVKFMNMILADNLDGYVLFGEPCMTTTPMIQAQISSNFTCENVSFIGRIHTGATPRSKTQSAIGYTGSGTSDTILKMKDCYLDGLRIGISFTPSNNASDFLTVENCKARIYGTEDAASQSAALNSFIVMSHCNAVISKNYFLGAGTYVNTFIDIIAGSGVATKMVVTGNHGAPATLSLGKIINDAAGTVFTSVIEGNAWGTCIDSQWYITVGGGTGSVSLGDFNGVGAINTIMSIANSISSFEATVIVNPGTYTITGATSTNFANLKFIGNKHGRNYPVFSLALTSGSTDLQGNFAVVLGNKLQSIKFVSASTNQSVRPAFHPTSATAQTSAHLLEVLDCVFVNASLYVADLSATTVTFPNPTGWSDEAGKFARTQVSVKDCHFFQDGSLANRINCLLPAANEVIVQNCFFTGNGYALSIGHNGYTVNNSSSTCSASIKDTIFDLTGYTISGNNSALQKAYIYSDVSELFLENVQVYADDQFDNATPISTTLTNAGSFTKFIHLKVNKLNVDQCTFVGPAQTYIASAVTYAMPTLYAETLLSGRISNSGFYSGACLLQVGGTAFNDGDFRENFLVENCHFESSYDTLIDYDLALANQDPVVHFVFDKCTFVNGTTDAKPFHGNSTDTTRSGAVQLFVGDAFVEFTNNLMNVNLSDIPSRILHGAIMINAYDNLGGDGDQISPVKISGNTIYSYNTFTSANANAGSAAVLVRASTVQVQNNFLSQYNGAAISASFIGCLLIDNPDSASGSESRGIVTGNVFSRKNFVGTSSNLARGYIQISPTSSVANGGLIANNVFDSSTYNGSSPVLVEDNAQNASNNITYSFWVVTQNQNQLGRQEITWATGQKGIATGADLNKAVMYGGVVSASSITADISSPEYVTFNYAHTGSQDQFRWNICLSEVLPPDVTITKVEYGYKASAVPGTTKTVTATLSGADGNTTDSNTIVDTNNHFQTITPSFNYTTKSTDQVYFHIQANINHSAPLTVDVFQIFVTYHW